MVVTVVLFAAGIGLLWVSSVLITRSVGPIARRLRVSEMVVTILGVSVFSSLPELSVSLFSALRGNPGVSIGNVVGSNFVTLTLVTALCAMVKPLRVREEIRSRESSWMILSTAMILVLAMDGVITRLDGVVLIVLYVPYLVSVIVEARREQKSTLPAGQSSPGHVWRHALLALAAIGGIIFGADMALDYGQTLAVRAGIPPVALGAILIAFGTSLPEMAIALAATARGKPEVTLGEIYSSNIFTALAVLGICAVAAPMTIPAASILGFDLPMLILAGVVIQLLITTGAMLTRAEAVLILLLYVWFAVAHLVPGFIPEGIVLPG
ncbi:sodium:calcium antiporter [Candidatus Fermentibacteria bacterium]|nr:sodium:calcium antiporter [Candidatus Fermentibacteria bacterium]